MIVGIDVGGTFTDGVLYDQGNILEVVKSPTKVDHLREGILEVLDDLLKGVRGDDIKRVVLSTTLITNLLTTGGGDEVALILIPGPGLNLHELHFFSKAHILSGATDFRGRITKELDRVEIKRVGREIARSGIHKVAIVGKFSQRNCRHECLVEECLQEEYPHFEVVKGFEVSGQLNFLRRAVTTYYTAKTRDPWGKFALSIQRALEERGITSDVDILKADGGTMSLKTSLNHPCESVFSGPAASVMGAFALTMDRQTSVVVDMGGTTTDLALILEGDPLHASRGATIGKEYSHIRSFALRSLALGGDSVVRGSEGMISIGPDRKGPAVCFGGPAITPTDAINHIKGGKLGNPSSSLGALKGLASEMGMEVDIIAGEVVAQLTDALEDNILDMFKSWEQEPAYKIWEIVHQRKVKVDRIVGIGAIAEAFVPALAKRFDCNFFVHRYSPVANALGAAVSRPTLSLLLHADTQRRAYDINIEGITGECEPNLQLEGAKELALEQLYSVAQKRGIGSYADHHEFFLEEQFNMIRGWSTIGKLYDIGIQIAPGVIHDFQGVK